MAFAKHHMATFLPTAWPTRDEIAEVCNPAYLASYSARRILAKPTLDHYNLKPFWKESESVLPSKHIRRESSRSYKTVINCDVWYEYSDKEIVIPKPEIIHPPTYWSRNRNYTALNTMTTAVAIATGVILAEVIKEYIWSSEEYKDGKTATGPFCPWCGRPEVEGFSPDTKVRCFCDRLYFIAERKLLHD
jgi:hypothetical protein